MKTRGFKLITRIVLILFCFSLFWGFSLFFPRELASADLSTVSDTLDDSRLSFVSALASGNSEGSSLITINTDLSSYGWATSDENFNLFPGDTLMVGGTTNYTVDDIIDDATDDKIQLTAGLNAGDADAGDPVIATRSATHTISLTTVSAITDGAFRIRVTATSVDASADDGIPDKDGFDFSTATWDMTDGDMACSKSSGTGTYNFGMKTATASGDTGCTTGDYHCFECRYNGAGDVGDVISVTVGGSTAKLINPSPSAEDKTIGAADTYNVLVEHMSSANAIVDDQAVDVAVVEAVRVTATVEPSITFTITAVDADSGTYCGVGRTSASPDSTAATVPFGALTLAAFNDAQQQLSCVTNAPSGYAVTIISDDQLSIGGDHSTEILNTDCDSENCTDTTSGEWSTENTDSGFGFSIQNTDANTVPFEYDDSTGNCTGTYCARMIPSTATTGESGTTDDSDAVLTIMQNTSTPTATEDIYVCYRLTVSTLQAAGDYENYITFVATATF